MMPFVGPFPWTKLRPPIPRGETVILSKEPLDETALRAVIDGTGYRAGTVTAAPYEKKGFFHFGK